MAVSVVGKRPGADFGEVLLGGASRLDSQFREMLDELRMETVRQAEHVVADQHLTVAIRSGTDANGRNVEFPRDLSGDTAPTMRAA